MLWSVGNHAIVREKCLIGQRDEAIQRQGKQDDNSNLRYQVDDK